MITTKWCWGLIGILLSAYSFSCTTIFDNRNMNYLIAARTMDLFTPDFPVLVVYPQGIERTGDLKNSTLKWTAKYGSIVIREFNTSAVSDGINEHGLAAHLLYLTETVYPQPHNYARTISNAQWAQYMLDNFKTVKEAVDQTKDLEVVAAMVHGRTWPIHLSLQDATGDSAIFEFIDGKLNIHHGKQYQIMTNEPPLPKQLVNLKRYRTFGGNLAIPGGPNPLSRFVRASYYLKSLPHPKNNIGALAGVVSVMRTVMTPFGAIDTDESNTVDSWPTLWLTVSDLTSKTYYFSSTTSPNFIWVDMKKFNFKPGQPTKILKLDSMKLDGDVSDQVKTSDADASLNTKK